MGRPSHGRGVGEDRDVPGQHEETFDFADRSARYVRYMGHGNTANTWNSVTEISVFGP
jgi:hypothetical protein